MLRADGRAEPRACVLFDLDGTLVDSRVDIAAALDAALVRHGLPPAGLDSICAMIGDGARRLVVRALAASSSHEKPGVDPVLAAFLEEYRRTHLANTHLYPGVEAVLRRLSRCRAACGVVSNKPHEFTLSLLEHLGIASYFAVVLGGDSLPERKPHPAPLRAALAASGASPERGAMVGDGETDMRAARAAGLLAVGATYGFRTSGVLEEAGAQVLIGTIEDLLPALDARWQLFADAAPGEV